MNEHPERIGILGGTFDPVHLGHLHVAERAREILGLERVLLLLSAVPPHKDLPAVESREHRLAMLRLAADERRGLEVSTLEIDRGGVSYTIDTLRQIRDGGKGPAPLFIVGMDSLPELPTWRQYRELVSEFDLVLVDRPGNDLQAIRKDLEPFLAERIRELDDPSALHPPPGAGGRILYLVIPPLEASSTEIRARVAAGRSPAGLVPPSVDRYIHRHRLFLTPTAVGDNALTPELTECLEAARDRKAEDIVILDLRGLSDVTDHFIVCHGTSDRQVLAIADSIEERLFRSLHAKPSHVEGRRNGEWVLMDYIDFVVHVFVESKREFYRLERLWGDAPRLELPEPRPMPGQPYPDGSGPGSAS